MTDDIKALVLRAFEAAREKGKIDWQRMTTAVLKNRLLQFTNQTFDEAKFGYQSFGEFVNSLSDILEIEAATFPPTVRLRESGATDVVAEEVDTQKRVRPDLWRAVLDYASGLTYVWDASKGEAGPGAVGPGLIPVPTVTKGDLDVWRTEFAKRHANGIVEVTEREALERWRTLGLSTASLPRQLIGAWNRELKSRVHDRIQEWAQREGIDLPRSILAGPKRDPAREELEQLRALVVACVQAMSKEELNELRLPPALMLKAKLPLKGS
jgi:hypothetical protein